MRAWWVLHVDAPGVLERSPASVHVAPCGDYHRRIRLVLPPEQARAWEVALGLVHLGLRGAAGVAYLGRRADEPERPWSLPTTTTARPVLLAEGPCRRPYGDRPLEGASGERLAALLGLDLSTLLESFEARNVAPHADPSPDELQHGAARVLELASPRRPLVVLGRAAELALVRACGSEAALRRLWLSVDLLPHPSGRSVLLNTPEERRRVRRACVAALCAVRGPGASARPPMGEVGNRSDVDSIVADGYADAWSALRRAGVVAPSRRVHHNWERVAGGAQGERFERRFVGGRAVVSGPPWSRGLDPVDGAWSGFHAHSSDVGAAFIGAEMAAARAGWRDPWDARTAELDLLGGSR